MARKDELLLLAKYARDQSSEVNPKIVSKAVQIRLVKRILAEREWKSVWQITFLLQRESYECMNEDIAFFEFRGKITNRGHAEDQGEPVHCIVKVPSRDAGGTRRRNVDLEQEAGDMILFALNLGPHRKMSHSSIRAVDEEILANAGPPLHIHRVGNSELHCY